MSSRLVRPGDSSIASPISWQDMGRGGGDLGPLEATSGLDVEEPRLAARLAQMEERCRRAVEQARAAGFQEGQAAAREHAAAEVRPAMEKLARSIDDLALLRPRLRKEAEADMLRLALAVARRILRRELAVDPEALHGLAIAALEKLGSQQICRVRVHPSMAAEIRGLLERSPGRGSVEVVADAAGDVGTVVFETERGDLDASVTTQLEEIERGLADRLARRA